MSEPQTPDWVRDAVFYQIFPDRFARSLSVPKPTGLDEWGSTPTVHGYQGGDLVGVVERLDYLPGPRHQRDLLHARSSSRPRTTATTPTTTRRSIRCSAATPALRRLLDECHRRGMRVVLDGVFNHASRGFFPFHDILENGQDSAYLDWFTVHSFPLYAYDPDKAPGYAAWWGLPALPKFNIQTHAVREFLWGIGRRWIDFGIDGWRLDVANEIDDDDFCASSATASEAATPTPTSSARSGRSPAAGSRATCGTP